MSQTMHVYTAAREEFVIAASPEDAAEVWKEHAGEVLDFGDGPVTWEQLPDDKVLRYVDEETGVSERKTYGEFATRGRGYFASANW